MRFNVFSISTGAPEQTHCQQPSAAALLMFGLPVPPVCERWAPTESGGLRIAAKDPETGKNNGPVKSVNGDAALIPVQRRGRSKYDAADVLWEVYHRPAAS